ncbi:hypothetical protein N0V83_010501 [Neocucurbitaria cava]|uniref:Microbial-type PARG catalytic domain-containing protein n=1 Tax=Neocucurbitaria cava TaxID=798079 RepID=A0A9W8XXY9_9PLEO|nr:hypothetical protein N0V83_010501 [Neocucurbitaria cava]
MGRTEKSQGLAPPAVRKELRAKQARHIINKVIPAILTSNARARKGAENSELIVDPGPVVASAKARDNDKLQSSEDAVYVKRKGQGRRKAKGGDGEGDYVMREKYEGQGKGQKKGSRMADHLHDDLSNMSIRSPTSPPTTRSDRKIRIISTDSLTAAHMLAFPSKYGDAKAPNTNKKAPNVCILNMASPLRPGGGVLTGATSQEEYLCARTTLLSSLQETFYRLPELGGIWTSDVLVFRSHLPLDDSKGELGAGERYWLDVISAGMLRFPELEGAEDEAKRLGKRDVQLVEAKMRAVLRIAERKGVKKLVLGAWGCGAYGNPVSDIARAWKKVLVGSAGSGGNNNNGSTTTGSSRKGKSQSQVETTETWPEIDTVVFAISNPKMAVTFAQAFDCAGVEVEDGPGTANAEEDNDEDERDQKEAEELRAKIKELEGQLSSVWNPDLKARIGVILEGLKAQLQGREGAAEDEDDAYDDESSGHEGQSGTLAGDEGESDGCGDEHGSLDISSSSSDEVNESDGEEDDMTGSSVKGHERGR